MHYYKRNLGDYAKKAGRLSMLQHGAYTLLIDACYDREQFPTREEAIDWTWASSTAEVEAVDFVLSKFFTLEDGRYIQKRIQEEIAAFHATSETNKRIAAEREAKRKGSSTNRVRSVDEAPPNQEPRTKNQEPEQKNPSGSAAPAKPPRKPAGSKRVPADFVVTPDMEAWAGTDAPLIDWRRETDKFRDWEFKTPRTDWPATWRTWMRKAQESAAERGIPSKSPVMAGVI